MSISGEFTIDCGLTRKRRRQPSANFRELELYRKDGNVSFDSDEIVRVLGTELPGRSRDLLDIAAYVSSADQAISRGEETGEDLGASWRRDLRFRIAVRDPDFWNAAESKELLADAVGFASDDRYSFDFRAFASPPKQQHVVPLQTKAADWYGVGRVLAFSGGIDSFAGALEAGLVDGQQLALVTLRSSTKLDPIQRRLAAGVEREMKIARGEAVRAHHFSVGLQRRAAIDKERTQRTRSFLFSAVGATVARALGLAEIYFYENGVLSLNLPVSEQVVGARATRTTHPKTLILFERLLAHVFGVRFRIENPFLWKTKVDVLEILQRLGLQHYLKDTVSCGSVTKMTRESTHCGTCSQCIDRRFAALAAHMEEADPASLYRKDAFSANDLRAEEKTIAESYVRRAQEIERMTEPVAFFAKYGEVNRALHALSGSGDENARNIFDLYKRHAKEVLFAVQRRISIALPSIVQNTPAESLMQIFAGRTPTAPVVAGSGTGKATASSEPSRATVVGVLHISDTHFSSSRWDQEAILLALANDVRRLREEQSLAADIVVCTGDIANEGAADEYGQAERWLRQSLRPAAGVDLGALVLVPGNHDVRRAKVTIAGRALRERLLEKKDQDLVAQVLGSRSESAPLVASHDEFVAFRNRVTGRTSSEPWEPIAVRVRGVHVHIAALCSSWASFEKREEGQLMLGRYQLLQTLPGAEKPDVVIAALHHPWNYLHEFDCETSREELYRRCDLVLRGHLHAVAAMRGDLPHTQVMELAAGAAYAGGDYPNRYQFIEWDLIKRVARVHVRMWDGHDWIADRNAFAGKAAGGFAELPLPDRR